MIRGETFEDAIASVGLIPPRHIEPGSIIRFPGIGKRSSNRSAWCRLFDDRRGGVFGDYSTDLRETWQSSEQLLEPIARPKPTPRLNPTPSDYATRLWQQARGGAEGHPYAVAKGITWDAGALRGRVSGRVMGKGADCVIVPIRDVTTGRVFAVQAINPDGAKQTFGPLKGHGLMLGNTLDRSRPWYVAEGWATAVSVVFHHHGGDACCAVAFGQSNLNTLAQIIAQTFKPDRLLVLHEVDQ